MPRDIFLSYVEEDGETARGLAEALRAQGRSTWTYQQDGVPGISYLTQVNEALEACRAFVLVASARSVRAHQVIREVEQAHEREKAIIVVRLGLTHAQFIASNAILRMASGTGVTLGAESGNFADIARRIAASIEVSGSALPIAGSPAAVYDAPPDSVASRFPTPAAPVQREPQRVAFPFPKRDPQHVAFPMWLWAVILAAAVQVLLGALSMLLSWDEVWARFEYPTIFGDQASGWLFIPRALSATAMMATAVSLVLACVAVWRSLRRKQTPRLQLVRWALFASAAAWIANSVVMWTPRRAADIEAVFNFILVPQALAIGVSWVGYWMVKRAHGE